MDLTFVQDLIDHQQGVVARRQLVQFGATESDLRRWLRKRDLVAVHPGVYAAHTGPLTAAAAAWAAVQLAWPAALCGWSALETPGQTLARSGDVIHIAGSPERRLIRRAGIRVHHLDDLHDRVLWHLSPPRLRFEDALIGICATVTDRTRALALLTDACRQRRTTPARLLAEIESRPNLRHRSWLIDVLRDAAAGAQSVLEAAYLRRVERAHGLPAGARQVRDTSRSGTVYRDVAYPAQACLVELDGRLGHELSHDRWTDMDRDLDAAVDGWVTIRLGWRHVEDDPCRTAERLARLLQQGGWSGKPSACGPGCNLLAPGTWESTDTG